MVRPKDPRNGPKYGKEQYGVPVVTISVDKNKPLNPQQMRQELQYGSYDQQQFSRQNGNGQGFGTNPQKHSHSQRQPSSRYPEDSRQAQALDEYSVGMMHPRNPERNVPRINFGSTAPAPQNCFKNVDSDYEEELKMASRGQQGHHQSRQSHKGQGSQAPSNGAKKTNPSFKTALSNHPLVKQQMKMSDDPGLQNPKLQLTLDKKPSQTRSHSQSPENGVNIGLGVFDKQKMASTTQKAPQPIMGVRRKDFVDHSNSGATYGSDEQQFYGTSASVQKDLRRNSSCASKVRLEDVQVYLEEIDELEEEPISHVHAFDVSDNEYGHALPVKARFEADHGEEQRQWAPLPEQRRNELEKIQKKVNQQRVHQDIHQGDHQGGQNQDYQRQQHRGVFPVKYVQQPVHQHVHQRDQQLVHQRDQQLVHQPLHQRDHQHQSTHQHKSDSRDLVHRSHSQQRVHRQNPQPLHQLETDADCEETIYNLELVKPHPNSKVKSVVSMINKEVNKSRENVRSIVTAVNVSNNEYLENEAASHYKSPKLVTGIKIEETHPSRSKNTVPRAPPPPQNLLVKAPPKSPKQSMSVNLSTDVFHRHETSESLPPPPPQIASGGATVPKQVQLIPSHISKEGPLETPDFDADQDKEDYLLEESSLFLQYLKLNWQIVDFLKIRIPRDVVDRMNRLPRKIVVLKSAADLSKTRKSARKGKRIGKKGKQVKYSMKTRAIERVASMKTDDLSRMVSEQSTLQRQALHRQSPHHFHQQLHQQRQDSSGYRQEDQFYARSLQRDDSFQDPQHPQQQQINLHQFHQPVHQPPQQQQKRVSPVQEQVYDESKWNIIKKGGRFVKKSAAALITRKQSPTPTNPISRKSSSNSTAAPQNEGHYKTESRIAAEIQNLREREDELRRNRVAMGLPTVDDLIGNWKQPEGPGPGRIFPLTNAKSFNHLQVNVSQQQKGWKSSGHYAMTKSESFHQLHQHPHQQVNMQPVSNQSSMNGKYLRNGEIPGSVSSSSWIPNDKASKNWHQRS